MRATFFGFAASEQGLIKEVQLVFTTHPTEGAQEEFAAQQGICLVWRWWHAGARRSRFRRGHRIQAQVGNQLLGGAAVGSGPETIQLNQEQRADRFADAGDRTQPGELLPDGGLRI